MKPFLNNMTQTNTNPSGWITSIVLHIGVFFVLLNTPILKEYTTLERVKVKIKMLSQMDIHNNYLSVQLQVILGVNEKNFGNIFVR